MISACSATCCAVSLGKRISSKSSPSKGSYWLASVMGLVDFVGKKDVGSSLKRKVNPVIQQLLFRGSLAHYSYTMVNLPFETVPSGSLTPAGCPEGGN